MKKSLHEKGDIYKLYKPLRNHICKLNISDAFYVVWTYAQHLQFRKEIPEDVSIAVEFLEAKTKVEKHIFEWELEIIVRELILLGKECTHEPPTLKNWSYMARAVNKVKDLENSISGIFINQDNILFEMFRLAHRQFVWQSLIPDGESVIRYYKIFSHPELQKIISNKLGLDIKQVYILAMALLGFFIGRPDCRLPVSIEIAGFTKEQANEFIRKFSIDFDELKTKLKEAQTFDDKYAYNNQILRANPLVRMKYNKFNCVVAPIPTLLFWKFTSGIYYELCNEEGFANAFGNAFENYVGEVIKKANTNKNIRAHKAESYKIGKLQKETVDWILEDKNAAFFIECKTKRMTVTAKFELDNHAKLDEELEKMAKMITQAYKTIKDYKENLYPNLPYDPRKRIFPIILTLEDWFLFVTSVREMLDSKVKQKLTELQIPLEWLDEMPYQMCTITQFEDIAVIIQETGLLEFMCKKLEDKEKSYWSFESFLFTEFAEYMNNPVFLFQDEYDAIFKDFMTPKNDTPQNI